MAENIHNIRFFILKVLLLFGTALTTHDRNRTMQVYQASGG